MGSEARLLLRAPLGVVEVEQKRALNHVGERQRLRASLAEEALQDGEDALRCTCSPKGAAVSRVPRVVSGFKGKNNPRSKVGFEPRSTDVKADV